MKKLEFRLLKADEIECRVGTSKEDKGISLLLYKDARVDMNMLDETVGPMNWQRTHSRDNANCTVSIWDDDKKQWISKEDVGTESNTEAEKGLASDSFKRACFNWGIGRELYTAPFIWISGNGTALKAGRYTVKEIGYEGRSINKLVIVDKSGKTVYTYGVKNDAELDLAGAQTFTRQNRETPAAKIASEALAEKRVLTDEDREAFRAAAELCGTDSAGLLRMKKEFTAIAFDRMTKEQQDATLQQIVGKYGRLQ